MTDIVQRLRAQPKEDHIRGCMGRQYSCDCGYDLKTEGLLEMAADEIERLTAMLKKYEDWQCGACRAYREIDERRALETKP